MDTMFTRSLPVLGEGGILALKNARVAVVGIGGVGGYAVEALARAGVGALDLIDSDTVNATNINRQIIATVKTIGRYKVDVAKERVLEINPDCVVNTHKTFYLPETAGQFDFRSFDYIVDAIDTVAGKISIAEQAYRAGVPVISCMSAGNKLNPAAFEVADLYKTSVCPLARVMRRELKKRGVERLKVVYSREEPIAPAICCGENARVPASVSFVPPVAGLIAAGEVIKDLAINGGGRTD